MQIKKYNVALIVLGIANRKKIIQLVKLVI